MDKILFVGSHSDHRQSLYTMNADGTGLTAITSNGQYDYIQSVEVADNGSKVVFAARVNNTSTLFTINAE